MPRDYKKRRRRRKKKKTSPEQQVNEIVSHRLRRRLKSMADEIDAGFKNMESIRSEHAMCIATYAGSHHPAGRIAQRRPLNVFQRAVSAYMSHLAGAQPEAEIIPVNSVEQDILSQVSSARATAMLAQLNYRRSKQLMVIDALAGFQVGRVGLCHDGYEYDIDGESIGGTKPMFNRISPADYVPDPAATGRENMRYEGHRFRVSADRIQDITSLSKDQRDKLSKWSSRTDTRDSESHGVGIMGRGNADRDDYWHDLIDVYVKPGYLAKEGLIVTLAGNRESPELLTARDLGNDPVPARIMEYEGHHAGPYIYQDIYPVPESVIGSSPAPGWRQLEIMINMLVRHIIDSESRRKKGITYDSEEGEALVRAMINAPDQFVLKGNHQSVAGFEIGGSSPTAWNSLAGVSELFSRQSGNTDQLSGQGPSRRGGDTTATEVASIQQALSLMLDSMENQMGEFDDEVVRRVVWYDFTDPLLEDVIEIMNMGVAIPVTLTPEIAKRQIEGRYHYKVRLGSMRKRDRAQIAAERRQGVAVVGAALQMQQLSQGAINAKKWAIQAFGDLYTRAEIDQWWADEDIRQKAAMLAGDQTTSRGESSPALPSLSTMGGLQSNAGTLGALFTGNQSPNFNQSALPQQTRAGMGF